MNEFERELGILLLGYKEGQYTYEEVWELILKRFNDYTKKLPSLDAVRQEAAKFISGDAVVTATYHIIQRLHSK